MAPLILSILGWAKTLAAGLGKLLADWRVLAVLTLAGVVVWLAAGKFSEARRADAAERDLKEARGALAQQKAHSAALEAARATEHAEAVADANRGQAACEARVVAARRSTSAIRDLLQKGPSNATTDPREPELLSDDELWGAIGR